MKIFIDSANLAEIEEGLKRGFASGITTNPSLLAKEPKGSFEGHIGKIIGLIKKYQPGLHLSVEVFSRDKDEILKQAQSFIEKFGYPQLSIKVQIGWDELEIIKELSKNNISVNCTALMTISQAMMAARAGAKYVSLFWARIRDGGAQEQFSKEREELIQSKIIDNSDFDPAGVVRAVRQLLDQDKIDSEIIVGSIRGIVDIRDAALAGAHIITIPPKFFPAMTRHYKTDEVVNQFFTDFKAWLA